MRRLDVGGEAPLPIRAAARDVLKPIPLVALRYGGSTSSSTAGVLACQWNKAPPFTLCRSHPPFWIADKIRQRKFYHKEHKEIIDGRFAAEASKNLENMECPTAPLVRGRLRPLYSEGG